MQIKPTILIVNDDSINSTGIKHLIDSVKNIGNIIVVAPDKPQSGMGHAITISTPLRFQKVNVFKGIESYQCNGTPADCVKIAVDKILKKKPDICLSGINHGLNHSISVLYSGTMSAAMEACLENIPSIGFSYGNFKYDADFSEVKLYVKKIVKKVLDNKTKQEHFLLNVNFPDLKSNKTFNGIKICKQAYGKFDESYKENLDPNNQKYYWLAGNFLNFDKSEESDSFALKNNFISIVPVQFDLTNYKLKQELEKWKF